MIKSVLIISRALPAYKLSRRQGPETFVVMYRPFLGECCSTAAVLGEGFQSCQVGKINHPKMFPLYRLQISPGERHFDACRHDLPACGLPHLDDYRPRHRRIVLLGSGSALLHLGHRVRRLGRRHRLQHVQLGLGHGCHGVAAHHDEERPLPFCSGN